MRIQDGQLTLSATDLANHLGCRHLSELERRRAHDRLAPPQWQDPLLEVLKERGLAHEAAYLAHLEAQGRSIERIVDAAAAYSAGEREKLLAAMRRGVGAIVQAPLQEGRWRGIADVLLRVEVPSALGEWSYLVVDTKLTQETRGGTVLQLCLYTDLLTELQGRAPAEMWVVAPGHYERPERFRASDFMAYYRRVKAALGAAADESVEGDPATYPEPVAQCDICRWWKRCDTQRRGDDHLSLVAGISRLQRGELERRGVATLTALAGEKPDWRPERGSREGYERVHEQARIQLASRGLARPHFELLPPPAPDPNAEGEARIGLARLPEPSAGDLFFDFEGDPFVEGGGLEFLFGHVVLGEDGAPRYEARWALSRADEKAAFESWIDLVSERLERHPDLHIYHFAPYEPAALKRLMGRHATREAELDELLRAERFVDLHAVVKESLRVGVEKYGLKELELVHGFRRELDLHEASRELHALQHALELGDPGAITQEQRNATEQYNREDCLSTLHLRNWLEELRTQEVAKGADFPRPVPKEGEPSEELGEVLERLRALAARLTEGVPEKAEQRSEEQQACWLLAQLLEFHRREAKATWWDFYRLADLAPEDLLYERRALFGLQHVERLPKEKRRERVARDRYRFPAQEADIRVEDVLHIDEDIELGEVVSVDVEAGIVDVKKRLAANDLHPYVAFAHKFVRTKVIAESIEKIGVWVADHGIDAEGSYRAARDLLLGRPPRLAHPIEAGLSRGEEAVAAASRLALGLDHGVLAIQGPPGTGKTYAGARMICALVEAGQRVGVAATSHKVIRNLLDEVVRAAAERDLPLRCMHKVKRPFEVSATIVLETTENEDLDDALASRDVQVGGGTAWVWSRDEAADTIDTLVIDEAGQMSLASTIGCARAARNLVLLGDPQQLDQPIQGSHPDGSAASALEHLLQGRETLPDHRGLFLAETWRLHPRICAFTSELYYEGRLRPREGCKKQRITGPTRLAEREGAGLWLAPVEHRGNQTSSVEEVARVAELVAELTAPGVAWTNAKGETNPLTLEDVLIVAPYNAQVAALRAGLPAGARVGTVDKFQGQEAAVVVYSLTASSADDAPRGLGFLLNRNRLNVATSRARCACVVVASPGTWEADCRTPSQMSLMNGLCTILDCEYSDDD